MAASANRAAKLTMVQYASGVAYNEIGMARPFWIIALLTWVLMGWAAPQGGVEDPPFDPKWLKTPNTPAPTNANLEELKGQAEAAPEDPLIQGRYADALLKAGRASEAEAVARLAVKLDKGMASSWLTLARALARQSKHDKAEAHFREALVLEYKNGDSHAGLGASLAAQKKWPQAERSFREAVRFQPKNGPWQAEHALCLYRLNRISEAKRAARLARQLGVKSHPVFKPLGILK